MVRTQSFHKMEIISYNFCHLSVLYLPSADVVIPPSLCSPVRCHLLYYPICGLILNDAPVPAPLGTHFTVADVWNLLPLESTSMSLVFAFPSIE